MSKDIIISGSGQLAYLPSVGALCVVETDSNKILETSCIDPKEFTYKKKKYRGFIPWGEDNDIPQQVIEKIYKVPDVTAPLSLNIDLTYGSGIVYGKYVVDEKTGKRRFIPEYKNKKINEFFRNNDINGYWLEQATDLQTFYNCFPEVGLNGSRDKIVEINHKEAAFSRWEAMNPKTGKIENHFYWSEWGSKNNMDFDGDKEDDIAPLHVTPVLDPKRPLLDLNRRLGKVAGTDGKKTKTPKTDFRYIVPVTFPTPGKTYYQKPYWYSIFEHWYDFVKLIPEFKKSLVKTMMTIKYVVKIDEGYFPSIFTEEKITDEKKQAARVKLEYENINEFLADPKNSGKAIITKSKTTPDGKVIAMMSVEAIKNEISGGEYLKDIEQGSNMISYAMNTHPSLIGAAPGGNKSINGTEARELFIIKQARMKPYRDRLLRPLYLIRDFNDWGADIEFEIMNLELTTLDKGTGAVKSVGNEQTE